MSLNHIQLKQELQRGGYTCVAYDQNGLYFSSFDRGVAPLAQLCDKNDTQAKLYLADKITGKAAALLTVQCGTKMLYTGVITPDALSVLDSYAIDVRYEQIVPYIKNRTGDGKCPMEKLAQGVTSPQAMLSKVLEFLEAVSKTTQNT